jgi:hypothetical protein
VAGGTGSRKGSVQGVEKKRRKKERGEKMCLSLVSERVESPTRDV